jgi:hypothetical protein
MQSSERLHSPSKDTVEPEASYAGGAYADRENGAPPRQDWIFVPEEYFPVALAGILEEALARLEGELRKWLPLTADAAWEWVCGRSFTGSASGAFRDLRAHIVLFPFLAARSGAERPDPDFESDLIFSIINGYYYCRLLDDVMDIHDLTVNRLAPVLGFFHMNFQAPYARWFPPEHSFWREFRENWLAMADATCAGAAGEEIDEHRFIRVASRKIAGIEAPMAAACFHRPGLYRLRQWSEMFRAFACFNEMQDAMFDWQQDLTPAEPTYLTSEATRRKRDSESQAAWIVREGLRWADETASKWMREAQARAALLDSPGLSAFLKFREQQARIYWRRMEPRLAQLKALADVLEANAGK